MYLNANISTFNELFIRESYECAAKQQWFVCMVNNFRGCCSVNPCQVLGCPDTSTAAVGASSSSSPSTSPSKPTTSASPTTSTTESRTTESSPTTSQTPSDTSSDIPSEPSSKVSSQTSSPTTILLTTTVHNSLSTSTTESTSTSIPSSAPSNLSQKNPAPKSTNSTPIIAGAVVGTIVLICIAMAAFFCFRYRQKKKEHRERMFAEPDGSDPETIQFYTTTGKSLQIPSSTRTSRSPNNFAGFFASVGKTSNDTTHQPTRSPPGGPVMTQTQIPTPIHPIHTVCPSPIPELPEDHQRDLPLSPDSERSSLITPPESSHPAFHPLPGMSSVRPAYRPGASFTINELDGREVDHVPIGTAGGRMRDSGSSGAISVGGRGEGSGSEGVVSAQSTPSMNRKQNQRISSNGAAVSEMSTPGSSSTAATPREQGDWRGTPNVLLPGRTTLMPSQSQSYHDRDSFLNEKGGGTSSSTPATRRVQARAQYQRELAQSQVQAQARRMNATAPFLENPYQMYGETREHQQNMGYENALVRAQEIEREREHTRWRSQNQSHFRSQSQNPAQTPTFPNGEEHEAGGLKRVISTHSIPIGLALDARPSAPPHDAMSAHASGYMGNGNLSPAPAPGSGPASARSFDFELGDGIAQSHVHASLYGSSGNAMQPLNISGQNQSQYTQAQNQAQAPKQIFAYRVVAPTPPPSGAGASASELQGQGQGQGKDPVSGPVLGSFSASVPNLALGSAPLGNDLGGKGEMGAQRRQVLPSERNEMHVLSWTDYDGGMAVGEEDRLSPVLGKGKGRSQE